MYTYRYQKKSYKAGSDNKGNNKPGSPPLAAEKQKLTRVMSRCLRRGSSFCLLYTFIIHSKVLTSYYHQIPFNYYKQLSQNYW